MGTTSDKPGQSRRQIKNTQKQQRCNPHLSHQKLAAEADVNISLMYRVLREDLGKKRYKTLKHHERMRVERSRYILNKISQGTLPNLVLTDKKEFDIHQIVNHQNN